MAAAESAQPVAGGIREKVFDANLLVEAALESDCDDCRVRLNIGSQSQRGCELREPLVYQHGAVLPGERDKS